MKSLEVENNITKIKAAVHLYANQDPTMGLVQTFEEKLSPYWTTTSCESLAENAEELGMKLDLQHPESIGHTKEDEVVGKQKIGKCAKKAVQNMPNEEIE